MNNETYRTDTLAIHGGQEPDGTTLSRAVPIYQTSSYVFRDSGHASRLFALEEFGNIYTRIMNPTSDVFEKRVTLLDGGGGAVAVSSGQSAISLALLNLARSGDEIVSASSLYGGTYNLFRYTFERFGITVRFADPGDPENFRSAIGPKTKALFVESIGNPKLDVPDFEAIAAVSRENGIPMCSSSMIARGASLHMISIAS